MRQSRALLALTLICGLLAPSPALGQPATLKWYVDHFTYFYRAPQPERLVGLIEKWQSDSGNRWDPYPPLVGFLAVVFRDHPNWIERLVPPKLTRGSATALAGALRLAGDPSIPPEVRSRIAQAGSDEILKRQLAGLPSQLLDLQITLPTDRFGTPAATAIFLSIPRM